MIVKDNWIATNIRERLTNQLTQFSIKVGHRVAADVKFQDAANAAAQELGELGKPLYLAMSGGLDSMFALSVFVRNKVPIRPIIYRVVDNPLICYDTARAEAYCSGNGIDPKLVTMDEADHVRTWYEKIFRPINGQGMFSVPTVLAAEYVTEMKGLLVSGDGLLISNARGGIQIGMNEWDVYSDAVVGEVVCPFFVYSPEIAKAAVRALPPDYPMAPGNLTKAQIYGLAFQPKITGMYASPKSRGAARRIASTQQKPGDPYSSLEDKKYFLQLLSSD